MKSLSQESDVALWWAAYPSQPFPLIKNNHSMKTPDIDKSHENKAFSRQFHEFGCFIKMTSSIADTWLTMSPRTEIFFITFRL